MKPGQIAQLQELSKCYMTLSDKKIFEWLIWLSDGMSNLDKKQLRRLTHQYQPQIVAIRKNRKQIAPLGSAQGDSQLTAFANA